MISHSKPSLSLVKYVKRQMYTKENPLRAEKAETPNMGLVDERRPCLFSSDTRASILEADQKKTDVF